MELNVREQKMRLYIVPGVPRDTVFETQTRKEISVSMRNSRESIEKGPCDLTQSSFCPSRRKSHGSSSQICQRGSRAKQLEAGACQAPMRAPSSTSSHPSSAS